MYLPNKTYFDIKDFIKKEYELNIYVNNYCNAKCDYCSMENLPGMKFSDKSEDMKKETFDKLISEIKDNKKISTIVFMGKEVSLWKHIHYALKKIKKIGKKSICFTNGLNKIELYTDNLSIHIDHKYLGQTNDDIKFYSEFCKKNNIKLTLGAVISNESDLDYYFGILSKYGDEFDLRVKGPIKFLPSDYIAVNKTIELYKKLYNHGIKGNFDNPILYCLINEENFKFLDENNIVFSGTCSSPIYAVISLDGKKTYPCTSLPRIVDIKDSKNYQDLWKQHFKYNHLARLKLPKKECLICSWYEKKLCQGGCLMNRF